MKRLAGLFSASLVISILSLIMSGVTFMADIDVEGRRWMLMSGIFLASTVNLLGLMIVLNSINERRAFKYHPDEGD